VVLRSLLEAAVAEGPLEHRACPVGAEGEEPPFREEAAEEERPFQEAAGEEEPPFPGVVEEEALPRQVEAVGEEVHRVSSEEEVGEVPLQECRAEEAQEDQHLLGTE
jgi:hypothetical protein